MNFIEWNIDPVIFTIGPIPIKYYSLLFISGIVLAYYFSGRLFRQEGVKSETVDLLAFYIVLGTLGGARIGHCLFYEASYYLSHPLEIILPFRDIPGQGLSYVGFQGLASHGGSLGIVLAILIFSRKYKITFISIIDKLAVGVPLTAAAIRFANLMNSEIIGKPAELPWSFIFTRVDFVPRHPAQLYEALAYLATFFIIKTLYSKDFFQQVKGRLFGLMITLIFTTRFFVEFIKENQEAFENQMSLNMGQILSIPFIIAGLILVSGKFSKSENKKDIKRG